MKLYDNYLSSGASTPLTATASSGSPNQYPDVNSYISPLLMTDIMLEIANVITDAGLSLDGTDRTQLSAAITALAGGSSTAQVKTTTFTAVFGGVYLCKVAGGGFTASLPASPTSGDDGKTVTFYKSDPALNGNTLTIGRNGENINTSAADLDIASSDGENIKIIFVWDNTLSSWVTLV